MSGWDKITDQTVELATTVDFDSLFQDMGSHDLTEFQIRASCLQFSEQDCHLQMRFGIGSVYEDAGYHGMLEWCSTTDTEENVQDYGDAPASEITLIGEKFGPSPATFAQALQIYFCQDDEKVMSARWNGIYTNDSDHLTRIDGTGGNSTSDINSAQIFCSNSGLITGRFSLWGLFI